MQKETSTLEVRGWYQNLYKEKFKGLKIADVGPGVGIDGIHFAEQGAEVTFVDIVQDNLKLIERVCNIKGIKANYYFIDDFFNYKFIDKFDGMIFIGSMHNAPFEFSKKQVDALMSHVKVGGKALMLAYPKERYIASGAESFEEFGKMTDGERTPLCEWYDDEKIKELFGKDFVLEWSRNFGQDNIEFNWFDLTKISNECLDNK
ncbi:class I SAM-dependent methyltransferase [Clostridium sp. OS1-26]|uniref:class I SAM-dependent methyltransferase n=1 Tax=Clostridium sp. OS1-26 TaxID=3070681 RepID=UPI0027E059FB|nr:class I SAM-dependent methyltransferase [Clostridium sp. OS1-26]WML35475.1 class I SAM-dependent methyltransferase [Clostridium sp. OS1-26]